MKKGYKDQCNCVDCSVNTMDIDEYYMLKEKVWLSIVPGREGMLCIGCVEKRLGRKLIPEDFSYCPLNEEEYSQPRSDRLLNRMGFKRKFIKTGIEAEIKYFHEVIDKRT